jgi:hypothetical protein
LSEESYLRLDEEVSPVADANIEMDYYSREPMPIGDYQESEVRTYSYSYEEKANEKPA